MVRKVVITLVAFVAVGLCVFVAGALSDPSVGVPKAILPGSECPAVGCAGGECHGFDNVPQPDGVSEMKCPESECSSTECHAWDALESRYRQASDASMNLWIVAPVVLVVGLVLMVRKL